MLTANEEVVLGCESHEVEVELACGGLHSKAGVRHPTGNVCGHGGMREFHLLKPVYFPRVQTTLREKLIEQAASTGIRVAIHKAHGGVQQPVEGCDLQRIAPL